VRNQLIQLTGIPVQVKGKGTVCSDIFTYGWKLIWKCGMTIEIFILRRQYES